MSDSIRKKVISSLIWVGGARTLVQAMNWSITLVVARILSPADYGLFGMAFLYIGLVEFLNEMGLGRVIIQKKELSDEQLYSLFWFTNGVGLFFFGVTFLIAPLVASFFQQPLLTHLLWFIGLIHVLSSLQQVPWNLLARNLDFKARSINEGLINLISGVATIVLAYKGCGVWALAWGFLIRTVVNILLLFLQTGWRPKFVINWDVLKPLIGFGLTVMGGQLLWYANGHFPILIIGRILGDHALGIYTLSVRLTTDLTDRILAVVNQVSFPVFSKMQDESQRLKQSFLTSLELVCACIFPILGGLILVSDDLIPLMLGPKWTPMIEPFKILAASGFFATLDSIAGPAVLAKNGPRPVLHINLLYIAVLPLGFYLGAKYGLISCCLVSVSVYPVLVMYWIWKVRNLIEFNWSEFWQAMRPSISGTIIMMMVGAVIKIELLTGCGSILRLSVTVISGLLAYSVAFLMTSKRNIGDFVCTIMSLRDTPPL